MPSIIEALSDESNLANSNKLNSSLAKLENNEQDINSLILSVNNQESISSTSSININNFMLCSSSSCGNYLNEGTSSTSSLGANQENEPQISNKLAGSDMSSSSRRSSISGDIESKLVNEEPDKNEPEPEPNEFVLKPTSKSSRKPKRANTYVNRTRRTRRIIRTPPTEQDNADADEEIEEDESDFYEDSESDQVIETIAKEKVKKFNCLDLDLFDYLLKRNLIKSSKSNPNEHRKLSLFTTSSEFVNLNDFETNLNINKYFYQLINLNKNQTQTSNSNMKQKQNKQVCNEHSNNLESIISTLLNDLVSQVEVEVGNQASQVISQATQSHDQANNLIKSTTTTEISNINISENECKSKSLIKTLLKDMSSLNSINGTGHDFLKIRDDENISNILIHNNNLTNNTNNNNCNINNLMLNTISNNIENTPTTSTLTSTPTNNNLNISNISTNTNIDSLSYSNINNSLLNTSTTSNNKDSNNYENEILNSTIQSETKMNTENVPCNTTNNLEDIAISLEIEKGEKKDTFVESENETQKALLSPTTSLSAIKLEIEMINLKKEDLEKEFETNDDSDNKSSTITTNINNSNETILLNKDLNTLNLNSSIEKQEQKQNIEILDSCLLDEKDDKENLNTKQDDIKKSEFKKNENLNQAQTKEQNLMNNSSNNLIDNNPKIRSISGESSFSSTSVSSNSTFNNDFENNNNNSLVKSITNLAQDSGNNIKKIVLKNNEVVLIEDCLDDEEEDMLRILKSKNDNLTNLFNEPSSSKSTAGGFEESFMSKSMNFQPNKGSKTARASYKASDSSNSDDPFVKAALERFDAFCKSKSTHNLDQTSSTTPSFVLNRQKSPYLPRKATSNLPDEELNNIKENVSSFIKRRQTRIDPCIKNENTERKDEPKSPSLSLSRSASETRVENSINKSSTNLASSSLAKKFLGSLTPQLDPLIKNEPLASTNETKIETEETPKLTRPTNIMTERKNSITSQSSPPQTPSPLPSPTSSSSDNSLTSSDCKSNKQVNIIKLEVFNSKKSNQGKSDEKSSSSSPTTCSKPPLPPPSSTISANTNPSSWRSKLKSIYCEQASQEGSAFTPPSNEANSKTANKPNEPVNSTTKVPSVSSTKPASRVIPIEIKNSKSNNTSSSTNNSPPTTNTKPFGSSSQRAMTKSTEKLNTHPFQTPTNRAQSPQPLITSSSTPSVQDRIRSFSSSYKESNEPNDRNLPFSFSRLRDELQSSRLADDENIYESAIRENPIRDRQHDPIVEKACSNFMTKLMEFQRQHKSAYQQPYTNTFTPTPTNSYQGPIVSSRIANSNIHLGEPVLSTVISPAPIPDKPNTTLTPFKSNFNSSYTHQYTSTYYEPVSSKFSSTTTSNFSTALATDPYSSSTTSTAQSPARPYVSAIRKRRTLFSDGFDTASTELKPETTDYISNYPKPRDYEEPVGLFQNRTSYLPSDPKNSPIITSVAGFSHTRNRPLSIVNEESNNPLLCLNRSFTLNETRFKPIEKDHSFHEPSLSANASTTSTSKPKTTTLLKKSNSITSANSLINSVISSMNCNTKQDNYSNSSSVQSTTPTKIRSTVFDRLSAVNHTLNSNINSNINNTNSESLKSNANITKPTYITTSSSKNPVTYEVKKKEENEIAIVTSMMPKTRRESIAGISSSNPTPNSALNRIRSLDSKSRDKFKSNNPGIKKTITSNSITPSNTVNTSASPSLNVPTCYLYANAPNQQQPESKPSTTSILKNTATTKSSTSIGCNSESSNENGASNEKTTRRKSQTTVIKTNADKKDVFERLSKRTNSLKNLANSNSANKSKTSSTSSTSSEEAENKGNSSNDEASNMDDNVFHSSTNSSLTNQLNQAPSNNHSISKTSVFERLYKSNIAAHMSHQNQDKDSENYKNNTGSTLKKNMSISSANLISSNNNQSNQQPTQVNPVKKPTCLTRQRGIYSSTKTCAKTKTAKDESGNEETGEAKNADEIIGDVSLTAAGPASSFLSQKLMDIFNK